MSPCIVDSRLPVIKLDRTRTAQNHQFFTGINWNWPRVCWGRMSCRPKHGARRRAHAPSARRVGGLKQPRARWTQWSSRWVMGYRWIRCLWLSVDQRVTSDVMLQSAEHLTSSLSRLVNRLNCGQCFKYVKDELHISCTKTIIETLQVHIIINNSHNYYSKLVFCIIFYWWC